MNLTYNFFRYFLFFALLPLLASCAWKAKHPPYSNEAAAREVASLLVAAVSVFKQKNERLQSIYYNLSIANLKLCGNHVHATIGAKFDTISNHPKIAREAQARVFGITDKFSVRSVISGSTADQAGLQVGDQITALDGQKVIGENWINSSLLPAVRRGDILSLIVERPDGLKLLKIKPVKACSFPVKLIIDNDITAITDGNKISMTTSAMRFFKSDDEIAFAISHEMSHNLLDLLGSNQNYEYASDYMAGYLMARAGYDVRHATYFFRRLAAEDPSSIPLDRRGPHPSTAIRITLLENLYMEIEEKKLQNIQLLPNIGMRNSFLSIIP